MIEIATITVRRPEILDRTFKSFFDHCLHEHDCRLVINVDNLGTAELDDVLKVAKKYFANVKSRYSNQANCMGAWKWTWQNTTADVVLWLEDDWILTRDIDLDDILDIMSSSDMGGLRLLKRDTRADEYRIGKCGNTQASMWWKDTESLFEITDAGIKSRFGITGNPCFYNGKLIRMLADKLDLTSPFHPEKFIRYSPDCANILMPYRYCAYAQPSQSPTVEDIGYDWRIDNGFNRKIGKGWRK